MEVTEGRLAASRRALSSDREACDDEVHKKCSCSSDLCKISLATPSVSSVKTNDHYRSTKYSVSRSFGEIQEESKRFHKIIMDFRASSYKSFIKFCEEMNEVEGSLKNCAGENYDSSAMSFPIYDPITHFNHHTLYLPRTSCRFIMLNNAKCVHLVVHLLPALERIYDLEMRAWRAMKMQLHANKHMPYWKKAVGHREICDQCATTIFNLHVMCFFCGYALCPKCFISGRPSGASMRCTRGGSHDLVTVSVIPDVPKRPLSTLRKVLHDLQSAARKLGLQGMSLERYYKDRMELFQTCDDSPKLKRIHSSKLLVIPSVLVDNTLSLFHENWREFLPVVVEGVNVNKNLWKSDWFYLNSPRSSFHIAKCIVDCRTGEPVGRFQQNRGVTQQDFWRGYGDIVGRRRDKVKRPMLLKLKDFPPHDTFKNILPVHYDDYCRALALKVYTLPHLQIASSDGDGGHLNLVLFLPNWITRPDLGPKLYVAFGMLDAPDKATTNLHLDITCAANLMCDVTVPNGIPLEYAKTQLINFLESEGFKHGSIDWIRVFGNWQKAGAIWTIWHPADNDKLRDGIKEMIKIGMVPLPHGMTSFSEIIDPINDQCFYLTATHRRYLKEHFGVRGCTLIQMEGDLLFIPAGAAHQVQNLFSCIKAAEDFVSPEGILMSEVVSNEFRFLTDKHANHEDKLQLSNIVYFAALEALSNLF